MFSDFGIIPRLKSRYVTEIHDTDVGLVDAINVHGDQGSP